MSQKIITIYTKEKGCINCTESEYYNFDLNTITLHRSDNPAVIWYYNDWTIDGEMYYINNCKHRIDGPAVIWYHPDGSIWDTRYYINDTCYYKEEYDNLINEMKALPKSLKLVHELWWVREL